MITVDSYQRTDEAIVDTSTDPSVMNYIRIPIVSIMSIGIFVMGMMIVVILIIRRRRKRRTTSAPNTSSNAKSITRIVTPSPSTDKNIIEGEYLGECELHQIHYLTHYQQLKNIIEGE